MPTTSAAWRLPGRLRLSEAVWRVRHQWVACVLLVHLPVLLVWALLNRASVPTILLLLIPTSLYLVAAAERMTGGRVRVAPVWASCAAAAGLMACSSFLVAVSGGYIEAHFHFFVMIPVVALYEDWAPFALAAGIVLLEHGVVGMLWPHQVYGHSMVHIEHPWLFALVHAGFVIAACLGSLASWTLAERARAAQQDLVQELHHRTRHDDLTGLANRVALSEELETVLAAGIPVAVLALDLDRFKEVNDTLGHTAGDDLLRAVAERATSVLTAMALPGAPGLSVRLGGDEFAVLLPGRDADQALQFAQHLRRSIGQAMSLMGTTISTSVSIGVAARGALTSSSLVDGVSAGPPLTSRTPEERTQVAGQLLREADVAMYRAKTSGAGTSIYDPAYDEHTTARLASLNDFRRALEVDDQIVIHVQPKVSIRTGALLGVEALARWQHPSRGLLPPYEFIAMATGADMSEAFSLHVLKAALRQCASWMRSGYRVPVSVNVTAHCLPRLAAPGRLLNILADHGVPADMLCLELTEDILVADPDVMAEVLTELRRIGVRCSVDDFGTGFSSLSYLRRLPLDELKIDRSFVVGLFPEGRDGPADDVVVGAIIDLGHRLGVHVVAEGVEHQSELEVLLRLGCDSVQGYLYAPPMPPARMPQGLLESARLKSSSPGAVQSSIPIG